MNWTGCPIVEIVPDKVSGAPLVKGTRLPAQTVLDNFAAGVAEPEIAEMFDVPVDTVHELIAYAARVREPRPV